MKSSKSLRAIAIICASSGIFVLYLVGSMMFAHTTMNTESDEELFPFVAALAITPLSIPPLMAALYGIRLFRSPSKSAVKGAIGGITILGTFVLVLRVQAQFFVKVEGNYSFLAVAIIALPIYVYASSYVVTKLLGETVGPGELVGRGIKGLIAFLTAMAYSSAIMDRMDDGPIWLPFSPILVGAFCYYILLAIRPGPKPPSEPA